MRLIAGQALEMATPPEENPVSAAIAK